MIGISSLFTLNENSKLVEMVAEATAQASPGDVGGSKLLLDEEEE